MPQTLAALPFINSFEYVIFINTNWSALLHELVGPFGELHYVFVIVNVLSVISLLIKKDT